MSNKTEHCRELSAIQSQDVKSARSIVSTLAWLDFDLESSVISVSRTDPEPVVRGSLARLLSLGLRFSAF